MKKIILLIQIFTSLLFISCNVTDSQNDSTPIDMNPATGGIYITGENTPDEIGVYGSPSTSAEWIVDNSIKRNSLFFTAFPNPFHGSTSLHFSLPIESNVKLTIVRARLKGAGNNDIYSIGGGLFQVNSSSQAIELINEGHKPGIYSIRWNGTDKSGKPVPAGFYRAYLQIGNNLIWRDLLVSQSKDDLPEELRRLVWFY